MTSPATHPAQSAELRAAVARLEDTIRAMQEQRKLLDEQRRRRLALIGGGVSLVVHIVLLLYLTTLHRARGGGATANEVSYDFAIIDEQELTELEQATFDELQTEQASTEATSLEAAELIATAPTVQMNAASAGAVPTMGGSGEAAGQGMGLGGGSAGTSFFGISSKGTRFGFIVDVSGSMGEDGKIRTAMRELGRSIEALPDFAHFYVLLFSSGHTQPPMQKGWTRARKSAVRQVVRWLGDVEPSNGTEPRTAFMQMFSLDARPDVVFFLTDGQIQNFTPEELAALNGKGRKAVINCIAFGDPSGQDILKQIARESGGTYRFVASGGAP